MRGRQNTHEVIFFIQVWFLKFSKLWKCLCIALLSLTKFQQYFVLPLILTMFLSAVITAVFQGFHFVWKVMGHFKHYWLLLLIFSWNPEVSKCAFLKISWVKPLLLDDRSNGNQILHQKKDIFFFVQKNQLFSKLKKIYFSTKNMIWPWQSLSLNPQPLALKTDPLFTQASRHETFSGKTRT